MLESLLRNEVCCCSRNWESRGPEGASGEMLGAVFKLRVQFMNPADRSQWFSSVCIPNQVMESIPGDAGSAEGTLSPATNSRRAGRTQLSSQSQPLLATVRNRDWAEKMQHVKRVGRKGTRTWGNVQHFKSSAQTLPLEIRAAAQCPGCSRKILIQMRLL